VIKTLFYQKFERKVKSQDIQKAVKNNGLDMMNDHALHLRFLSLRPIERQNIPKDAA
jgi:hypothetical protein